MFLSKYEEKEKGKEKQDIFLFTRIYRKKNAKTGIKTGAPGKSETKGRG